MNFEYHALGWKGFQDLCATIFSEVLGQTYSFFSSVNDAGRDGAFYGTWKSEKNLLLSGSFTIQCKHTSKSSSSINISDLKDEISKAKVLVKKGLSDNYILITNHIITAKKEDELRTKFLEHCAMKSFHCFGPDWITLKIRESPKLRMIIPRIYGLGDLSQILDQRAYDQAKVVLSYMREEIKKIVVTDAYKKSAKSIIKHGFVILLGEPASGKTTIASSLILGTLDMNKSLPVIISSANEFEKHWNPHEPNQLFWVDDVFGTTQYQKNTSEEWNKVFPKLNSAIKAGTKVIFTSRDYIFKSAIKDIKSTAFPLINYHQVKIKVEELSHNEKERILYNHIKLGDQSAAFKTNIKPFLHSISRNKQFLPEIARRLGTNIFTSKLDFTDNSIRNFVEEPVDFLYDIIKSLDKNSFGALILIFMNGGYITSPVIINHVEEKYLQIIGANLADIKVCLNSMSGSLVLLRSVENENSWTFKHPTISDALASIVADNPEFLDIYLKGAKIENIILEVSCGLSDIKGIKVVVSKSQYGLLIQKLSKLTSFDNLVVFLATRCDQKFISDYLQKNDKLNNDLLDNYYLASSLSLFAKLFEYGLLSDDHRESLYNKLRSLALYALDTRYLESKYILQIFGKKEIDKIFNEVLDSISDTVNDLIDDYETEYDPEYDPEDHYYDLISSLDVYRTELEKREMNYDIIELSLYDIDERIEYLRENYMSNEPDYDDSEHHFSSSQSTSDRSIFDDIDM